MKTMGQIVREWRKAKGLSAVELASRVGESRQNIENFEADEVKQPRYLHKLAAVMGYARTDDLIALQAPPEAPAERRTQFAGDPRQILDAGNPSTTVDRLCWHLQVHSQTRREVVGDLLQKLARNPANAELASEVAILLVLPSQESQDAA